jgi:hypothetical protein
VRYRHRVNTLAWEQISFDRYEDFWEPFDTKFDFRPSSTPTGPAIAEPEPSVTIDLGPVFVGPSPTFAAGKAAVNALALLAMTKALPAEERLLVLDWQHLCHWFWPHRHAVANDQRWSVEVFPNGDYYAFLTQDMTEGTFGHPWEQTLCIFGRRLMPKLVPLLTSWLPIKRQCPP